MPGPHSLSRLEGRRDGGREGGRKGRTEDREQETTETGGFQCVLKLMLT